MKKWFFQKLTNWASKRRRTARVVPINLRYHGKGSHEHIHRFFFSNWKGFLSSFFSDKPNTTTQLQYSKYSSFKKRLVNWYITDVLAVSIQLLEANGRSVKKVTGKGYFKQFSEMVFLAIYLPSMPENYYKFEWYHKEYRRLSRNYLHRYELKNVVYKAINQSGQNLVSVTDKLAFAQYCLQHNINCVPTIGFFKDGEYIPVSGSEDGDLGNEDVFIKPVSGKGGSGADRVEKIDADQYKSVSRDKVMSKEKLFHYYQKKSLKPK